MSDEVEQRLHDLIDEVEHQESATRFLRDEINNLERICGVQGHRGGIVPPEGDAGAEDSAYGPTLAPEMSQKQINANMRTYPPEYTQELCRKCDDLRVVRDQYVESHKDLLLAENVLRQELGAEDDQQKHLTSMRSKCRWTPGGTTSHISPIKLTDEHNYLQKKIEENLEINLTSAKELFRTTQALREMTERINALRGVPAERFDCETDLRLKKKELELVNNEIGTAQRLYAHKDRLLNRHQDRREETVQYKYVEHKRRVQQHRLLQYRDESRKADAAIRHRALQIQRLEEKVEMIGEAIRGDVGGNSSADVNGTGQLVERGPEQVPRVDALIVDQLRSEVGRLSREAIQAEHLIGTTDAALEMLEVKLQILQHAKESAIDRDARARNDHFAFRQVLAEELGLHQADVAAREEALVEQIVDIQKHLAGGGSLKLGELTSAPASGSREASASPE